MVRQKSFKDRHFRYGSLSRKPEKHWPRTFCISNGMEYRPTGNGWKTFLEHWWFLALSLIALLTSQVLIFFTRLTGLPWIWCYVTGLVIAAVGLSLIFYARIPLYQQQRFFTFGSRALPVRRRPFYRWGYRCVILAVALLLCLLLSTP